MKVIAAVALVIVALFAFVDARQEETDSNEQQLEDALIDLGVDSKQTVRGIEKRMSTKCEFNSKTNAKVCCLTSMHLCASISYDEVKKQYMFNFTAKGIPFLSKVLPAWELGFCETTKSAAVVCANITNQDLSPSGACGCFSVTMTVPSKGMKLPTMPWGCFAFGKSAGCTNCDGFHDQIECQTLSHCGWCCSNNRNCEAGTAKGSTSQPMCTGNHWAFDQKSSCVP